MLRFLKSVSCKIDLQAESIPVEARIARRSLETTFLVAMMTVLFAAPVAVWARSGVSAHSEVPLRQSAHWNATHERIDRGGSTTGRVNADHFHHPHHHHRELLIVGAPFFYYLPSQLYSAQAIGATTVPTTFTGLASDGSQYRYWNYCSDPAGFYPAVLNCASGWQAVPEGSGY